MNKNHTVGGVLSIISGVFGFFHSGVYFFLAYMFRFIVDASYIPYTTPPPAEIFTIMTVIYSAIGAFFALLSILGIVGGVYALKKKRWALALTGAIAGTLIIPLCGIPAIIFVTLAKQEFSTTTE